jgi:hypothetical protein
MAPAFGCRKGKCNISFNSFRVIDGYQLDPLNNSFVTRWLDVHSSPFWNLRVVFSSPSADGYLTLEDSCDRQGQWTDGNIFPESARFVGAFGKGPLGDPFDLATVSSVSLRVSGNATAYVFDGQERGSRWIRLKYIANTSVAQNVHVTCAWKTSS